MTVPQRTLSAAAPVVGANGHAGELNLPQLAPGRRAWLTATPKPAVAIAPTHFRAWLDTCLTHGLTHTPAADWPVWFDPTLNAEQQRAAAAALASPDVSLMAGSGPALTAVAIEVVKQEVRRGHRVIWVSPAAAELDRVIRQLADDPEVLPVRLDEPGLHPESQRLTRAGLSGVLPSRLLREADDECRQLEQQRSAVRHWEELAGEVRRLEQHADDVPADTVTAEKELHLEEARLSAELDQVNAALAELQPLAEARQQQRWWSGSFWKATLAGNIELRADQNAAKAAGLERSLEEVRDRRRDLAEGRARDQRERRVADLTAARTQLADAAAALPGEPAALEAQLRDSQAWCAWVREHAATVPDRWADAANVICGSPAACRADAPAADLVVIDAADNLSDADLIALAAKGQRWLLLARQGEPARPNPNSQKNGTPSPPAGLFARLWHTLHTDTLWHDGTRWHCRLVHEPPHDGDRLEREPLADDPTILLTFLARSHADCRLAKLTFPGGRPLPEVRALILRELGELPVPAGSAGSWSTEPHGRTLRFRPDDAEVRSAEVAPGVVERLVAVPQRGRTTAWHTAALCFDPARWSDADAHAWTERHLRPLGYARTAVLHENPSR